MYTAAFRSRKLAATDLVNLYLERIKAHNGTCVKGDLDPATGLHLGDITGIAGAQAGERAVTLN